MAGGGKREGAGRKKGIANTKTRELAERALQSGASPLEIILKDMRELDAAADAEPDKEKKRALRREAREAAKDAAPYTHPRLQPVDGRGSTDQSIVVKIMSFSALPVPPADGD